MTANQIEFSLDTFRIKQIISKRMDLNYTTSGMNRTVIEATDSYDSLMNKYYKKTTKQTTTRRQKYFNSSTKGLANF